ncbi:MAG: glycoside hydrolase family 28 protein [Lachnospiraceae bacterium]
MNKLQLKESILKQIDLPYIRNTIYPCSFFNIKPDSSETQTLQLQRAIDTISQDGGGRLILPSGNYLTGALWLKSGVELHLQNKDTRLTFINTEIEKNYPMVLTHWESTPCFNYSPLIYAWQSHDIAVTGEGILDGSADSEHWWNWHHQVENAWFKNQVDLQLNDRRTLRKMNAEGVDINSRKFGPGHFLRPNFIQMMQCERILLSRFTMINSPMWQVNPVMCKSVTVDGITLQSHGSNNDGCDPESCDGVHILRCRFDTGDDCISIKSGRDRDGRLTNTPCRNIVIEQNEFADGHGGIALGSEMSGGIYNLVAIDNYFSSPHLTYALRLKTNARRGGTIENIVLADSKIDHMNGAAVHGTMLYEDGRNGDFLPSFRNILIENIDARGGDYGIFLESFPEVPITGLVLKNITIDGSVRAIHSMHWKDPIIENVVVNGNTYPRPTMVRIKGITQVGSIVHAIAESCGSSDQYSFEWKSSFDGTKWTVVSNKRACQVPDSNYLYVSVTDPSGQTECSRRYRILKNLDLAIKSIPYLRLLCRGIPLFPPEAREEHLITRVLLAQMLLPIAEPGFIHDMLTTYNEKEALLRTVKNGYLPSQEFPDQNPQGFITRQEMATVAMQVCGINYKNASSTMPECTDAAYVDFNYGTNVARSLYFGFMILNRDGCFFPTSNISIKEAVEILDRVADFAGA